MSKPIPDSLQIHYFLDYNKHEMNAYTVNKCTYQVLKIISEIASKLDAKIEIITFPYEEGGLKQWLKIVKKNEDKSAPITTEVIKYLAVCLITGPFYIGGKILVYVLSDNTIDKPEKKELVNYIENNEVELSASENKFVKLRSNFYNELEGDRTVNKIEISSFNPKSEPVTSKSVKRGSFSAYILNSNRLEPEDIEEAIIFITAPVIAQGTYNYWHGKYNGEDIKFVMYSDEFKSKVQQGEVSFKNGFSINCLLRVYKILNENGDEKITKYEVIRVNNYFVADDIKETKEGKNYRIKKEIEKNHLFSDFEEFK